MWIASPLLLFVTMLYIQKALVLPATDVYGVGTTAFGVTVALAGVCFTMPGGVSGSPSIYHAGEKFLHSSLLLIQGLMLIYIKGAVADSAWGHTLIASCCRFVIGGLFMFVSSAAAFCWFWGFEAVNSSLWGNWELRMLKKKPSPKDATKMPEPGVCAEQSRT